MGVNIYDLEVNLSKYSLGISDRLFSDDLMELQDEGALLLRYSSLFFVVLRAPSETYCA